MDKQLLKHILLDNHSEVEKYVINKREINSDDFNCNVFVGVRRSGKSYLMYDKIQQMLSSGSDWSEMFYLNFEDERLEAFHVDDFEKLIECHQEIYGKQPIMFLDEIQNIPGWEKFARRMADTNHSVFLTGSNAKMLSGEINSVLGGRYMTVEVYPYSFREYLNVLGTKYDEITLLTTEGRSMVVNRFQEYLKNGGLPAAALMPAKRNYISSVYQKIYLGDIIARNAVSNVAGIGLLVKKLAECVCRPVSFNRLNNMMSSVGGKLSLVSTIKYVDYCEDAWLIIRLKNYASSLLEKECNCKYYFIDNGILGLFLMDKDSMLLENIVALQLFRHYGRMGNNDTVYFYNDGFEVDFYIPQDEIAIQVAYSLNDGEAYARELKALNKISRRLPCKQRLILTFDENGVVTDEHGSIEIIPVWQWLLNF